MEIDPDRTSAVPLRGRSSVLSHIAGALDATERGDGRVVLITGPAGVGKSAVLDAAIQRARGRGFRIAAARAVPRDTPVPYDLIRELLPKETGKESSDEGAERRSGLPPWLTAGDQAGVVSGFPTVAVLPEDDSPVEKRVLRLFDRERLMIDLGRRLLHAQLDRALLAESHGAPGLLAVDDLHHADRDSLEFLRGVANGLRGRRMIIVATVDTDASPGGTRGVILEAITKGVNSEVVGLSGLSLDETAEVIRDTHFDPRPSPEYVRVVHQRSKGIPAAIEQLARRYKGAIPPLEKPGEPRIALAEAGFWTGSLPEETQRILIYAAVIGRQFDLANLARTVHRRSGETLEPLLAPLVENGTLRRRGRQAYEFVVPSVRQELYSKLPEGRRRLMHRNVARALEVGARPAGPELFEIAFHYHLAGETVPSVEYNRRAADVAAREYAYEEARIHLERALDSLSQLPSSRPESERVVRVALGHVLTRIGKVEEAIQILDPLRDSSQTGSMAPSALEQLFVPEFRSDLWAHADSARTAAERALRAYRTKGDLRWLALAHRALGVAAWSLADPSAAEEHHHAAAQLARLAGDAQLEGQSLLDRAHLVRLLDPNGVALSRRLLTESIERFTASGDPEWLAKAYLDRSAVLRTLGRLPDALNDLTAAAEHAARSGSPALETWVELRTARVLVEEGRTGRARKTLERLRQIAGESPRREVEQQIAIITGMLQEREGRLDKARALFERSLELAIEAGAGEEAADSHRRLAELERKAGNAEEAERHLREAERLSLSSAIPAGPRSS